MTCSVTKHSLGCILYKGLVRVGPGGTSTDWKARYKQCKGQRIYVVSVVINEIALKHIDFIGGFLLRLQEEDCGGR